MKKTLKWMCAVLGLVAITLLSLHIWLIDGLDGLIWGSLFQEDTAYATGYSDSAWRSVRIGMAQADVHAAIGEPLQIWTNEDASVGMSWSSSPGDTHYRCRVLQFRDGHVLEKHAEFYVD